MPPCKYSEAGEITEELEPLVGIIHTFVLPPHILITSIYQTIQLTKLKRIKIRNQPITSKLSYLKASNVKGQTVPPTTNNS